MKYPLNTLPSMTAKVIYILSWIVSFGILIKTGSLLYSYAVSVFVNPIAAENLYSGLNLSSLFEQNKTAYHSMIWGLAILTLLKAVIVLAIMQLIQKVDFKRPFSELMHLALIKVSVISLLIGLITNVITFWHRKITFEISEQFAFIQFADGGDVFMFFSGILFFFSYILKKGIELQSENDLTI